jgi:hypothetical protein
MEVPRQQVVVARVAAMLPSCRRRGDQYGQGIPWRPAVTESVESLQGFSKPWTSEGHRSEAAVGVGN